MVDDSHAVGFVGPTGRGTPELPASIEPRRHRHRHARQGARRRAAAATSPAAREIVELLRQRSRPYLFSNTLAPPIVGAALAALDLLECVRRAARPARANTALVPRADGRAGFDVLPGEHPIVPVMIGDAAPGGPHRRRDAGARACYVIGFSYPVVPKGKARIRMQLSAAHTHADLEQAVEAFAAVRARLERGS